MKEKKRIEMRIPDEILRAKYELCKVARKRAKSELKQSSSISLGNYVQYVNLLSLLQETK